MYAPSCRFIVSIPQTILFRRESPQGCRFCFFSEDQHPHSRQRLEAPVLSCRITWVILTSGQVKEKNHPRHFIVDCQIAHLSNRGNRETSQITRPGSQTTAVWKTKKKMRPCSAMFRWLWSLCVTTVKKKKALVGCWSQTCGYSPHGALTQGQSMCGITTVVVNALLVGVVGFCMKLEPTILSRGLWPTLKTAANPFEFSDVVDPNDALALNSLSFGRGVSLTRKGPTTRKFRRTNRQGQ